MAEEAKLSKVEHIKDQSRQLRGTLGQELQDSAVDHFGGDSEQLLKPHGIYQQEDRDARRAKVRPGETKSKHYMFMTRTRIPGGRITADQFLAHVDLCEKYANGTLRLTTRQAIQLHGVLKEDLQAAIQGINRTLLTTLAACGDVTRNVMSCPAPFKNNAVRDEMQAMADRLSEHLKPKTTAYHEVWLTDDSGTKQDVTQWQPVDEPIYGKLYLPRKFKIGVALPDDNCIDILTQDLGFLAIVEQDRIVGYNAYAGGGMGVTPSAAKTFVSLAKPIAFVTPDQVLAMAEAVIKVQRDFGYRDDRKRARLKYLIFDWGVPAFKAKVDGYFGQTLPPPRDVRITDAPDHIGWHEQGDGKLFLGINIETGRIKDDGDLRIKTGLKTLFEKYRFNARLTALQSILLCDIDPKDRDDINRHLAAHGIKQAHELTLLRRYSIACPAFPTCGLSITESERALPGIITDLESVLAGLGLKDDRITIHMTGCPNGCARPYNSEIGFVGKAAGKYTVLVGGSAEGTRLSFIYKDLVPQAEIVPTLKPLLAQYKAERHAGETFGDYCHRMGPTGLGLA